MTEYYDPADGNFETHFDEFYEKEENKLFLQFEIQDVDNWSNTDDRVKCLVCMNVDQDSELRNGDKGFAACNK